jgi:hypothetical protein
VLEGSTAVLEYKVTDQTARCEICTVAESFILGSHQANRTHIKRIAVLVHNSDIVEVTWGRIATRGAT